MIGTNLGSIYASLKLDTSDLTVGVNKAKRDIAEMGAQISKNADSMVNVGNRLTTGLTLPLLGVGIAAGKMSMDFGEAIAKIQGLAGAGADSIGGIRKAIEDMAPAVAKSPKELADAMYFVYSAGIKGDAAVKVLNASAKAASAGLGDVKSVADAVTSAVNAYGQENITAAHATDVLVAAVREGKVESTAMAGAIGRVLPVAANMGISFDNVAAAMASMTRSGLNADEAATSIRGTLAALLKPGKQAQDALASVGLSAAELRKELSQNLITGLQHLSQAFAGNDEALAKVFPNIRALTGVLNLTGQSAENVSRIFSNVTNSAGATDAAFKTMEETTGHKLKSALVSLQVGLIKLGDSASPAIVSLAGTLGKLGSALAALPPSVLSTILAVAALVAAIGPALTVTGNLSKVISTIGTLSSVWAAAAGGALPLIAILAAVGVAIYGVVKAVEYLSRDMVAESRIASDNARAQAEQARETKSLVAEYENLRDKSQRTQAETSRMNDILQKIAEANPEIIKAWDEQGNALGLVANAAQKTGDAYQYAYRQALNLAAVAAKEQKKHTIEDLSVAKTRMTQAQVVATKGKATVAAQSPTGAPLSDVLYDMLFTRSDSQTITFDSQERAKALKEYKSDLDKYNQLKAQLLQADKDLQDIRNGILPGLASTGAGKAKSSVNVGGRIAPAKVGKPTAGMSAADRAVLAQQNAVESLNQQYDAASQKFDRLLKAGNTAGATTQLQEMNRLTIALVGAEDKLAEAKKHTAQQDSTKKKPLPKTAEEMRAIDLEKGNAISGENERYYTDRQKLLDKAKDLDAKRQIFDQEQRDKRLKAEEVAQSALIQLYETTGNKEAAIKLKTEARIRDLQAQGVGPIQALAIAAAEAERDITSLHDEQAKTSRDLFTAEVRNQVEILDYKRRYNQITVDEYATALEKMKTATVEQVGTQSALWIELTDKTADAYADQADKVVAQAELTARKSRKSAQTMLQDQLTVYKAMGDAGVQAAKVIEAALLSMQKRDTRHVKDWVESYQAALGQIGRNFEQTLTDWITGTNSFKDFWKQAWREIVQFAVHQLILLAGEWVKTQVLVKKGLDSMSGGSAKSGIGSTLLGGLGTAIAGPVGGAIGSVIGKFLKFDDPINDTWAVRLGQSGVDTARSNSDFARLFTQGAQSRISTPAESASARGVAVTTAPAIHVTMNIDKVTGVEDLERAADSMAWAISRKLKLTPTGA